MGSMVVIVVRVQQHGWLCSKRPLLSLSLLVLRVLSGDMGLEARFPQNSLLAYRAKVGRCSVGLMSMRALAIHRVSERRIGV